ncbi:MAG: Crp/Fnr family transcriptional regulator [Nitrospira sp.]|nr:Crp/Fnr family transcriptional regulator [Nitrospira sp.]
MNAGCRQCPERARCPLADLVDAQPPEPAWPVLFTEYRAGQYICTEHEPMIGLHVVCTGAVAVYSCNTDGHECGLHLVGAGGYLNATDTLLQKDLYSVSAKVLIDAAVAVLRQGEFQRALQERPTFALKLVQQVGRQMKRLEERQGELARNSACERMLTLLRILADLGGEQAVNGVVLPATLARADLASLIATTPETISRLLSKLQKSGVVRSSRSAILIPSIKRLTQATCCEQ